jgi:hypothetical protein
MGWGKGLLKGASHRGSVYKAWRPFHCCARTLHSRYQPGAQLLGQKHVLGGLVFGQGTQMSVPSAAPHKAVSWGEVGVNLQRS